jgi:hypothetical protein
LPDNLFQSLQTVGDVVRSILSALERNGYVERSFFRTKPGGVVLVTRLERINDDGSSLREPERWSARGQGYGSADELVRFLRGLFFVDPGRYRVIVFILQDSPFYQSEKSVTGHEARTWLHSGANVLSPEAAESRFAGVYCTALVYEFASDGAVVRRIDSRLTGKQHLAKAGLLSVLEKAD